MRAPCPRCNNEIDLPEGIKRGKLICPYCGLYIRMSQVEDDAIATCPKCRTQFLVPVGTTGTVMCPSCATILSTDGLFEKKKK